MHTVHVGGGFYCEDLYVHSVLLHNLCFSNSMLLWCHLLNVKKKISTAKMNALSQTAYQHLDAEMLNKHFILPFQSNTGWCNK